MDGKLILTNEEERTEQECLFHESKKKYPHSGKYYLCKKFVEKIYSYKDVKLKFSFIGVNHFFNFIYLPANDKSSYIVEVSKKSSSYNMCATLDIEAGNLTEISIRVY
jgi:hypothetical protein